MFVRENVILLVFFQIISYVIVKNLNDNDEDIVINVQNRIE